MSHDHPQAVTFQQLIGQRLLEIGDGYRAKLEELGGDGPIFLRAGHVEDTHIDFDGAERFRKDLESSVRSKMSKPGDTIVTTKGNSTGRTAYVTQDMPSFVYSPHLSYWRSRDSELLRPRFLRYWALGTEFRDQLDSMKLSTDMAPYLSLTDQRRLSITLPQPVTQHRIARILGSLDDKIELNRRMNRTLEAMAQVLFDEWAGENEGLATTYKTQDLIERKALVIGDGYRAKRIELSDEGLPFARAGNLNDGFDFQGAELLGAAGIRAAREKVSQDYDAVFTSKGSVGRLAQVLPNTPRFVYAPQLCYWRVLDRIIINPHVLFRWMKGREFNEQLDALKGQTDMADYVSLGDQRRMEMRLPLAADQLVIGNRLDTLARRLDSNSAENRSLASLRDFLLPRLLSGEIRVGQAEKIIEAAS